MSRGRGNKLVQTDLFHIRGSYWITTTQSEVGLLRQRAGVFRAVAKCPGNILFLFVLLCDVTLFRDIAVTGLHEIIGIVGHLLYWRDAFNTVE